MKTLGLVYACLGKGGIERGASFQIPMFRKAGWRVVVFTSFPSADGDYRVSSDFVHVCIGADETDDRSRKLADALRGHGVEMLVHHDAYRADVLAVDLAVAHDAGVKAVVFWHSVFTHFLLRRGRQLEAKALFEACRRADAMITLSEADAAFFRLYGVPAQAIPYADPDLMDGFSRSEWPCRVVWMGRFVELKRPLDAVKVFELVQPRFPDAEFVMLGAGDEAVVEEVKKYLDGRPALARAVRLAGFHADVRPFLETAGVGLLTSRFEGYCHSLVEFKMASLPVVAYEMPWLDTLAPGTGAVQVPQGDVAAAATAVCRLLGDPSEARREGLRARAAYEVIAARDQDAAYADFFGRVARGDLDDLRRMEPTAARAMIDTFVLHADAALRLIAEEARDAAKAECAACLAADRSYRVGRILTWPYRIAKRIWYTITRCRRSR